MILRLAIRSLTLRPMRTAVLAIGFGLGIAVMAELVGVGEVILEQAHSPALAGGGDLVASGPFGSLDSGRFVLTNVLASPQLAPRVRAASPARKATVYLLAGGEAIAVAARGGIPDRERAIGDPEIAGIEAWRNSTRDGEWTTPTQSALLRAMDRFHAVPSSAAADFAPTTWAEWLYFNGRSADGSLRFYLTFLSPGSAHAAARPMLVRLQLQRNGTTANFSAFSEVDASELVARAPDIDAGANRVRVDDAGVYRITLGLNGVSGDLALTPAPGRSVPPAEIHGARGWVSGYVVPVLTGTFSGTLRVRGEEVRVDGAAGYHDHNWGFWEGVRWQWGQVAGAGISIVYGRVFPPADVADRSRVPGFMGVLGADGPLGVSTDVTIDEDAPDGMPRSISIESRDRRMPLTLQFTIQETVRTPMALTRDASGTMTFIQMGGEYRVTGKAGGRALEFTARGSAETFR